MFVCKYPGNGITVQLLPISNQLLQQLPFRKSNATNELVFAAENIPPLGYKAFYIQEDNFHVTQNIFFDKTVPFVSNSQSKSLFKFETIKDEPAKDDNSIGNEVWSNLICFINDIDANYILFVYNIIFLNTVHKNKCRQ